MINEKIRPLAQEFKQEMERLYGDRLDRVILFGSYARGDYHEESDVDFMVVLKDESISRLQEILHFSKTQSDLSIRHGKTVSILPVSLHRFRNAVSPVDHFAHTEGILL